MFQNSKCFLISQISKFTFYQISSLFPLDISEEILKKYRNIQPQPAGLMEDDQSCNDRGRADFAKQAEFDEDFKFEDAKRKLRLVLCMADRSNFPR